MPQVERHLHKFQDYLQHQGLKLTPERTALIREIFSIHYHFEADELLFKMKQKNVKISRATVYRTLELLEELELVRHAHLGHGAPSYRPAEDDHIHVVCHTCGKVVDADPNLVDAMAERLRTESGFRLDRSHFTVFGRCSDCVEQTRAVQR